MPPFTYFHPEGAGMNKNDRNYRKDWNDLTRDRGSALSRVELDSADIKDSTEEESWTGAVGASKQR
jgi:hypothetical protein